MKGILQDKEIVIDTYDMLMKSDMGKAFPDIARNLVRRNRHVDSTFDEFLIDENIWDKVEHERTESGDYDGTTTSRDTF